MEPTGHMMRYAREMGEQRARAEEAIALGRIWRSCDVGHTNRVQITVAEPGRRIHILWLSPPDVAGTITSVSRRALLRAYEPEERARAALVGEGERSGDYEESLRSELAAILRGHGSLSDSDWAALDRFIARAALAGQPARDVEREPYQWKSKSTWQLRVCEICGRQAADLALTPSCEHRMVEITVAPALAGQPEVEERCAACSHTRYAHSGGACEALAGSCPCLAFKPRAALPDDTSAQEEREVALLSEDNEPIKLVDKGAREVWEPRTPERSEAEKQAIRDDVQEHLRKRREAAQDVLDSDGEREDAVDSELQKRPRTVDAVEGMTPGGQS